MGRFGFSNPFEFSSEIISNPSGSSVEYFRSLNPNLFGYELSLSDDVITSESDILEDSLALMGAVEIVWKNADKRLTFTPTPLDDYVWRYDGNYSWFNVLVRVPSDLMSG